MLRAIKVTVAGMPYLHVAPRQMYSTCEGSRAEADVFCSVLLETNDATYNGRVLSMGSVSSLSSTVYLSTMSMVRLYAWVRSSPPHSRADSLGRSLRSRLLHFGLGGLHLALSAFNFLDVEIFRDLSHRQRCRRLGKSLVVQVVGP